MAYSEIDWTIKFQDSLEHAEWVTGSLIDKCNDKLQNAFYGALDSLKVGGETEIDVQMILRDMGKQIADKAKELYYTSTVVHTKIKNDLYWELKCNCGNKITWGAWDDKGFWESRAFGKWNTRTCKCGNVYKLNAKESSVQNIT